MTPWHDPHRFQLSPGHLRHGPAPQDASGLLRGALHSRGGRRVDPVPVDSHPRGRRSARRVARRGLAVSAPTAYLGPKGVTRDVRIGDASRTLASQHEHSHCEAVRAFNASAGVAGLQLDVTDDDISAILATLGE